MKKQNPQEGEELGWSNCPGCKL